MKHRKVRKGMFETNSSSMHSIVIAYGKEKADYDTASLKADEKGVVAIGFGEFGWEQEQYTAARIKASYAATFVFSDECSKEVDGLKKQMLEEVLLEVTGGTQVVFNVSEDECYQTGYIDHNSLDIPYSIFENKEVLKDFIFNKNVTLITDNDNH